MVETRERELGSAADEEPAGRVVRVVAFFNKGAGHQRRTLFRVFVRAGEGVGRTSPTCRPSPGNHTRPTPVAIWAHRPWHPWYPDRAGRSAFPNHATALDGQASSSTLPAFWFTTSATQPQVSMQPSRRKSLAPVQSRPCLSISANVCRAIPICRRLLAHCERRAASRALATAGNNSAAKMPMMPITTSSSISVNANRLSVLLDSSCSHDETLSPRAARWPRTC